MSGFITQPGLVPGLRPDLATYASYSTCGNPRTGPSAMGGGVLSRRRSRKQRGGYMKGKGKGKKGGKKGCQRGGCGCMMGGRRSRKQRGGAGYTFLPGNQLGPGFMEVGRTACQGALPNPLNPMQRGGALLSGSPIDTVGATIAGSSLSAPALGLQTPGAAFSFDMTGSSKLADLKVPYPEVISMPSRAGAPSCRSRTRRSRK